MRMNEVKCRNSTNPSDTDIQGNEFLMKSIKNKLSLLIIYFEFQTLRLAII